MKKKNISRITKRYGRPCAEFRKSDPRPNNYGLGKNGKFRTLEVVCGNVQIYEGDKSEHWLTIDLEQVDHYESGAIRTKTISLSLDADGIAILRELLRVNQ